MRPCRRHASQRQGTPGTALRIDVFLEAQEQADASDILVVDNVGRHDKSLVGDLVAREVADAGLVKRVIRGVYRDNPRRRKSARRRSAWA
jgi:regulator of RNase E activity RraA